ncbi:MAG: sulfite exporter TauE/SafE family protein [Cytophagaceae bacterium]
MENLAYILPLLFIVAYLYASVGHGGASGYLAVMGICAISPVFMKSSALILNIFVAGITSYSFIKNGHFKWKLFYPFALMSIPAAFIGASYTLNDLWYKKLLALCLIIAALRIIFTPKDHTEEIKQIPLPAALCAGAAIGLLSGMLGIGGGILLSPLILFLKWGRFKEAAATSAVFIWINSIAGIAGVWKTGIQLPENFYIWIAVALAGGLAGSYWGSFVANYSRLKFVLSSILIFATIKLLL